VIDAGSSSPEDLVQRADIYNSAFDYDKAINDYCTSIQMDPLYLDAYRGRATAYMAREKYDLAVKDLQVVLRSNPSDSESLYNAGIACMLADLPAAATSFFDKALEGEKSDHWRNLVRVQMARLSEASAYEERVGGLAGYLANIGVEPRGDQLLAGRSQSEAKQQKGIAGISDQRQVAAMKSDFATLRKDLTSPRPEDSHLTGDLSGTHMGFAWGFHFDSKGRSVSGILRIRGPAGFEETHSCTGTLDRGLVEMSDHTGYRFQGRINEALRLTGTLYTSRGQSFSVDVPLRE
jgi:tetratricopeptide (TPR) repeat protein